MQREEIPLIDAAARLGISYNRALRMVLIGRLRGFKHDGHWMVSERDLQRVLAERDSGR